MIFRCQLQLMIFRKFLLNFANLEPGLDWFLEKISTFDRIFTLISAPPKFFRDRSTVIVSYILGIYDLGYSFRTWQPKRKNCMRWWVMSRFRDEVHKISFSKKWGLCTYNSNNNVYSCFILLLLLLLYYIQNLLINW